MFSRSALDIQIWDSCRRVLCGSYKDKCTKSSDRGVETSVLPGESLPQSFQQFWEVPKEWLARYNQPEPPAEPECTVQVERWALPELAPIACKGLETKDAKKRASMLTGVQSPFQPSHP